MMAHDWFWMRNDSLKDEFGGRSLRDQNCSMLKRKREMKCYEHYDRKEFERKELLKDTGRI